MLIKHGSHCGRGNGSGTSDGKSRAGPVGQDAPQAPGERGFAISTPAKKVLVSKSYVGGRAPVPCVAGLSWGPIPIARHSHHHWAHLLDVVSLSHCLLQTPGWSPRDMNWGCPSAMTSDNASRNGLVLCKFSALVRNHLCGHNAG